MPSVTILAGRYHRRALSFVQERSLRPTSHFVRAAAFNILLHRFFPHRIGSPSEACFQGCEVLDLFAGLGSYGFEALSRGAEQVTFVESSYARVQTLKQVAQRWGCASQVQAFCQNLPELTLGSGLFHVIFMDPPYDTEEKTLELLFMTLLEVLHPQGLMVLEYPRPLALPKRFSNVFQKPIKKTLLTFFTHTYRENES